jgi:xanthine dehydrogenase/oxidase
VAELKGYILDVNLVLGAATTLSDAMDLFLQLSNNNEDFSYLKQFYEHMDLVAHIPVKNVSKKKVYVYNL